MSTTIRKELFGPAKSDSSPQQLPSSNADSSLPQQPNAALSLDAVRLQARLAERVQAWDGRGTVPEPEVVTVPDSASTGRGLIIRRSIKTLLALAVAIALGWTPLQRLLQTTSAEAAVNARLVTLRAPIDAEISLPRNWLRLALQLWPARKSCAHHRSSCRPQPS
jgi:hypothetical protein